MASMVSQIGCMIKQIKAHRAFHKKYVSLETSKQWQGDRDAITLFHKMIKALLQQTSYQ